MVNDNARTKRPSILIAQERTTDESLSGPKRCTRSRIHCALMCATFFHIHLSACDDEAPVEEETSPRLDMYRPYVESFDASPTDTGGDEISVSLKAFGEPCSTHSDCLSDFCIYSGEEGVCTETCLGTSCPEGWGCLASSGTGPDIQYLCSPIQSRLCKACAGDGDCPLGRCINLDGQSVCGKDCETDRDCIGAYHCSEIDTLGTKQCIPQTFSCSCNASTEGEQRVCEKSNQEGSCYGRQFCDSTLGWSACDAPIPAPEQCNLIDDDCNGLTDDVPLIGEDCSNEAAVTHENGMSETLMCHGRLICTQESLEPICTADTPIAELCNYRDDDCDGDTDESFPQRGELCQVGEGSCARYGVFDCSEDGLSIRCSVVPGESSEERCDGVDNDCDGRLDEGFEGVGEVCEDGQGLCRRVGVRRCSEGGDGVMCSVTAAAPTLEVCDGLDNDCDGVIDNGFIGLNEICVVGVGFCQQAGFMSCTPDGQSVACGLTEEEVSQNAQPELCDRVDNDCDQKIDEDYPNLNEPCQVGQGACERRGLVVCSDELAEVVCSVSAGEPSAEQCNGSDDDCDGQSDENWPLLGQSCTVGLGICERSGVVRCDTDGRTAQCSAEIVTGATTEACDYLDDDCDGQSDEDYLSDHGVYSQVNHCGACGNDCSQAWGGQDPASLGVNPICDLSGERPRCSFECLPGFLDADGRLNNGCELYPDPNVVYVTPEDFGGSSSGACGSINEPCYTLSHGIVRARALGLRRVLASEGLYAEVLTLSDGISVIGGHDRLSWTYNPNIYISQLDTRSLPQTQEHRYTVKAIGVRSPTELRGFTIQGGSSTIGNSYAVYLRDCDQSLMIQHNRIIAGDGARGSDGESGESGVDGFDGQNGVSSRTLSAPLSCGGDPRDGFTGLSGGRSPEQVCNGISTRGGQGGYSACPIFMEPNISGAGGGGINAGFGGISATHFQSNNPSTCAVTNDSSAFTNPDARSGVSGGAGADGSGGLRRGSAIGRINLGHWFPENGSMGEGGVSGGGGGGGGAAAGVVVEWSPGNYDFGASGGSGGNGGCPGSPGVGGQGGGGSFGIFVSYLSLDPSSEETLPVISDNVITRGFGGVGGRGGNGGGGGAGGAGGEGGDVGAVLNPICSFQAGSGGAGGRGGHGGAGAGGNGGVSFDIAVSGQVTPPNRYLENNEFTLPLELNTAGQGGVGGNSSNTTIGRGERGLDGLSHHVGDL